MKWEEKQQKKMDPSKATKYFQSTDWESCYQTAEHLYEQGDYREAFSWYEKASLLPSCNPIVFFELGYLFQHGEGVDVDNIEALKWYEKAASLGVPQAMYNLAYFYQNGLVVNQDIQKAARLLRDATSLMDHLQLERDCYDIWKADYDARLAEVEKDAKEKQERSESLESRNRELNMELSTIREECLRLERDITQIKCILQESEKKCEILVNRAESAEDALQKEQKIRKETEYKASAYQTQMEEWSSSSEKLITHLVKEHNESFERMQSSCASQIDRLQNAYQTDFAALQKANAQIREQNENLARFLEGKMSELKSLKKETRIAFTLAGIFGLLALILLRLVLSYL